MALTAALAVFGLSGTPAHAASTPFDFTTSGTTSLTITGFTGTAPNDLVIPSQIGGVPVTAIGPGAFWGVNAKNLTISEGVTSIGRLAFYGSLIHNIVFGSTLTSIGDSAFELGDVFSITFAGNAPSSLGPTIFDPMIGTYATVYAVYNATGFGATWQGIPVVRVPEFMYTTANGQVTITGYLGQAPANLVVPATLAGKPVVALAANALQDQLLTSITLPDSLTSIGTYALGGNLLSSIVIPASVTNIGDYAFTVNPYLTSVVFKGNAPSYGLDPFFFTNPALTSVTAYSDATGFGLTWDGLTVNRVTRPSNDVSLASLTATDGTLNEVLSASTTAYSMTIAAATSIVLFEAASTDAGATVTVDSNQIGTSSASAIFTMDSGPVTTSVTVLAADGVTSATYSVIITRAAPPSNDSDLGTLALSDGKVVTAGLFSLTASVASGVSEITLTAAPHESHATMTANGNKIASGVASAPIALGVGDNTITIQVTSQSGTHNTTYDLVVTRAAAPDINNAKLSALSVSSGALSPTFDPTYFSYEVFVASNVDTFTVTPTVAEVGAAVAVNGITVVSGQPSQAVSLSVGDTYVTILTTAPNGYTNSVYFITVHRATPPSTESTLSNLIPTTGSFNETFVPTTTSYTMDVASDVTTLALVPNPESQWGTVTINAQKASGWTPSNPIALAVGQNTITVEVTAQDGITKTSYTVLVTRAVPIVLSNDATLSLLLGPNSLALSPSFAPDTTTYSTTVPNATSSTWLVGFLNESHANLKINGVSAGSGIASDNIGLNVGLNVITLEVTAQDGVTTKTYTVNVTRSAPPLSSDATLLALGVSGASASPTFSSGQTSYSATVPFSTATIQVTPTVNEGHATVTVNGTSVNSGVVSGAQALAVGVNTITVLVTAQDGSTKTYTITVTRSPQPLSSDATLSSILVPGTLPVSPSFAPNTTTYSATVPNATTGTWLAGYLNESHASLKINGVSTRSGFSSATIPLIVGINTITVLVTAQDGSTKTYTITVTRSAAPVVITKPVVNASSSLTATTKTVGGAITATTPTFNGSPSTMTYAWYRCTAAVTKVGSVAPKTCTAISGATKASYKIAKADKGKFVALMVTARNTAGTAMFITKTVGKL